MRLIYKITVFTKKLGQFTKNNELEQKRKTKEISNWNYTRKTTRKKKVIRFLKLCLRSISVL